MASPTDIANLALQHLGESPINSIEDTGDKVSRTCKVNFEQARDEVLQAARWTCAKRQVAVSKLSQAPLYKWSAAYQLPSDFLRLVEIEGEDAWVPREYFDLHGKTLLLGRDQEFDDLPASLNIEYLRKLEDTTLFDPLLVDAISLKLACRCARILTGSDTLAGDLMRQFEQVVMPRAMTINTSQVSSIANPPHRKFIRNSLMMRARRTTDSV
jgi:hypothetical protein